MDGCSRQNPAYRPASERAPGDGSPLHVAPRSRSPAGPACLLPVFCGCHPTPPASRSATCPATTSTALGVGPDLILDATERALDAQGRGRGRARAARAPRPRPRVRRPFQPPARLRGAAGRRRREGRRRLPRQLQAAGCRPSWRCSRSTTRAPASRARSSTRPRSPSGAPAPSPRSAGATSRAVRREGPRPRRRPRHRVRQRHAARPRPRLRRDPRHERAAGVARGVRGRGSRRRSASRSASATRSRRPCAAPTWWSRRPGSPRRSRSCARSGSRPPRSSCPTGR